MVNVNCVDISSICQVEYEVLYSAVSEERQQKSACFRHYEDAKRCVCAEVLLRYSLYQFYHQCVEPDICYNEYGKPYLKNLPEFHYNVSHSGDWVVLAYGDEEVGVDIEMLQSPSEGVIEHFFSKRDVEYINGGLPESCGKRFIQTWTLKESYIKYLGTGLSTSLDSFFVDFEKNIVYDILHGMATQLFFDSVLLDTDYYIAVCSGTEGRRLDRIPVDELIRFVKNGCGERLLYPQSVN